ncbi:hypothetical protein [Cellulomonas fimi]|nr:hypothetical protein [Cellulomonas fimi]
MPDAVSSARASMAPEQASGEGASTVVREVVGPPGVRPRGARRGETVT